MRPLFHPAVDGLTVESVLHALSDPVRVAIYADIVGSACARNCSSFLKVSDKAIPKSTLSQHLKILREAGLIRGERHGIQMRITSRCGEIEKRFPGLIAAIVRAYLAQSKVKAKINKAAKRKQPQRRAKS